MISCWRKRLNAIEVHVHFLVNYLWHIHFTRFSHSTNDVTLWHQCWDKRISHSKKSSSRTTCRYHYATLKKYKRKQKIHESKLTSEVYCKSISLVFKNRKKLRIKTEPCAVLLSVHRCQTWVICHGAGRYSVKFRVKMVFFHLSCVCRARKCIWYCFSCEMDLSQHS